MHIEGHWLDITTGKEHPIVLLVLSERAEDPLTFKGSGFEVKLAKNLMPVGVILNGSYYVALNFVQNPHYERAFRQMMSDAFEGPIVLPEIIAIGNDLQLHRLLVSRPD